MRSRPAVVLLAAVAITVPALSAQRMATAAEDDKRDTQSLGDIARAVREKQTTHVEVTKRDAKELFAMMNDIFAFASNDSGLPRRTPVKHQLVDRQHVEAYFAQALAKSEQTERVHRSEVVLKKFGMLPADFDLKAFMGAGSAKSLGGYYDFRDKTMYLLNWIPLDKQYPIMAHELTHALQDQNYDLMRWRSQGQNKATAATMKVNGADSVETVARTAVVEGQAMLVYYDYLLKPYNHTLADSPEVIDAMRNSVMDTYDSPVVLHNAPLLLKEMSKFPYFDGLSFELELLKHGGKQLAFTGALMHPPRNTHDIMHPEAYIQRRDETALLIPDLTAIIGPQYQAYDTGTIGELDVRIMTRTFGRDTDVYSITPNWRGGSYVAVKRTGATPSASGSFSTSDIALLYVSEWKDDGAAERFAELYKNSLVKRTKLIREIAVTVPECPENSATCGPLWASHLVTDQGPVVIELWPRNILMIAQGFEEPVVGKLRQAVLRAPARTPHLVETKETSELTPRLLELPEFQAFQREVFEQIATKSLQAWSAAHEAAASATH